LHVPTNATPITDANDATLATGADLEFAEPLDDGLTYITNILDPGKHWWLEQEGGSFLRQGRTDAKSQDTDGDGLTDYEELTGYRIALFFAQDPDSECVVDTDPDAGTNAVICTSDPLNPDTDGDTLPDGGEVALRADPSVDDGLSVLDLDADGLLGGEEDYGWEVVSRWLWDSTEFIPGTGYVRTADGSTVDGLVEDENMNMVQGSVPVTTRCGPAGDEASTISAGECYVHEQQLVSSEPLDKDTDNDGLDDLAERDLGLHPRDTVDLADVEAVITNPLDYDSDLDEVSDGDELVPYPVGPVIDEDGVSQPLVDITTDPNGETDTDGLSDLDERDLGTNAGENDTDGDGLNDLNEILAGSDPLRADQVCVAARFTKVTQTNGDCDGTQKGNGSEILGDMYINNTFFGKLDKNLSTNTEEQIPSFDPIYALLDRNTNVKFTTGNLRECDGNGDLSGADKGAEGLGDGQIDGNCKLPAYFDNVDHNVTFDDYLNNQTEIIVPKVNTFGSGGELCELEFKVSIQKITDGEVGSASSGKAFCGGAVVP
jgi:hypothetical protein